LFFSGIQKTFAIFAWTVNENKLRLHSIDTLKEERMSEESNNRREFLKKAALGVALGVASQALSRSDAYAQGGAAANPAGGKLEMVKPTDPQAQALGYVEDAKKADVKKFPKRATPEGKKQFCHNCQFFQAAGDPDKAKEAPCMIFGGKGVKGSGWCNSWTQNPKAKM
jgi:hypothetical protein